MTIEQIIYKNRAAGHHFFDYNWMHFFNTRVHEDVVGRNCFVTSECDDLATFRDSAGNPVRVWNGERRFTVRRFNPADCQIESVSEFGQFATFDEAIEFAKAH